MGTIAKAAPVRVDAPTSAGETLLVGECLQIGGDWTRVARAMYESGEEAGWAENVVAAVEPLIHHPLVGIQWMEYGADTRIQRVSAYSTNVAARDAMALFSPSLFGLDAPAVRSFFFPQRSVMQLEYMLKTLADAPHLRGEIELWMSQLGLSDGFATTVHPRPGLVLTLFVLARTRVRLTRAERGILAQLGLHLDASVRLRSRPETLVAVFGADGAPEYLRADFDNSGTKAPLAFASRRGTSELRLWRALVAGELTVVERQVGGRRLAHFYENPPHRQPFLALTNGEQDVLSMVCHGYSGKAVAYGLGISEATVSTRLESATSKLGLASRLDLVRIAAMLTRDPRARFAETTLTTAERDVLGLVSRGLSNAQIAKERRRSIRTIANQVASLLTKTGVPNRKALAAKGIRGEPSRDEG